MDNKVPENLQLPGKITRLIFLDESQGCMWLQIYFLTILKQRVTKAECLFML